MYTDKFLQFFLIVLLSFRHLFPNSEDRADGDETIDVGRAIQGVKGHDILPMLLCLHLNHVLILLGDECACRVGILECANEEIVGDDV